MKDWGGFIIKSSVGSFLRTKVFGFILFLCFKDFFDKKSFNPATHFAMFQNAFITNKSNVSEKLKHFQTNSKNFGKKLQKFSESRNLIPVVFGIVRLILTLRNSTMVGSSWSRPRWRWSGIDTKLDIFIWSGLKENSFRKVLFKICLEYIMCCIIKKIIKLNLNCIY